MVSCSRCLKGLRNTLSVGWTDCARSVQSKTPRNGRRLRVARGSELLALVARNGAMHVYTGCRECHANLENGRLHPAENIDITLLPVGLDQRLDNPPCQVCGSFGTEVHHWAPSAVFGREAAMWPTGQLCRDCHAEWHRRMEEHYSAKPAQLFRREA